MFKTDFQYHKSFLSFNVLSTSKTFSICKKNEVSKSDLKIHITFHYVNLLDKDR